MACYDFIDDSGKRAVGYVDFLRALFCSLMKNVINRKSPLDIHYEILESKIVKSICKICETMVAKMKFCRF